MPNCACRSLRIFMRGAFLFTRGIMAGHQPVVLFEEQFAYPARCHGRHGHITTFSAFFGNQDLAQTVIHMLNADAEGRGARSGHGVLDGETFF